MNFTKIELKIAKSKFLVKKFTDLKSQIAKCLFEVIIRIGRGAMNISLSFDEKAQGNTKDFPLKHHYTL